MPPASGKEQLQIGRRGELLVQSRLLRYGIESSAMTLDYGIDLIALRMEHDNKITPVSIQVKTTAKLYEKDGKQECYSWGFPKKSPADLIAFVAADEIPERIWLFDYAELRKETGSSFNFDLYTDKAVQKRWTMKNFNRICWKTWKTSCPRPPCPPSNKAAVQFSKEPSLPHSRRTSMYVFCWRQLFHAPSSVRSARRIKPPNPAAGEIGGRTNPPPARSAHETSPAPIRGRFHIPDRRRTALSRPPPAPKSPKYPATPIRA